MFSLHDNIISTHILSNINKCRDPGSNRGPSDLRSDALPTELSRQMMMVTSAAVLREGLPALHSSTVRFSFQTLTCSRRALARSPVPSIMNRSGNEKKSIVATGRQRPRDFLGGDCFLSDE